MTPLARRLARRYLPHRVRAAALTLAGRPVGPATRASTKAATGAAKRPAAQKAARKPGPKPGANRPAPAPVRQPLVEALSRGEGLTPGMVAQVRAMVSADEVDRARALGLALQADAGTAELGRLVVGLVAGLRGYHALAWTTLSGLPDVLALRWAPEEFVRAGLSEDPAAVLARLDAVAAANTADLPAKSWLQMVGPVYGFGALSTARDLFARFDERVGDGAGVPAALVVQRDWWLSWITRSPEGRSAPPVPAGRRSFAIMDYGHPSRTKASNNIGDHIQSLASLGHLVRHQGLTYHGPSDLTGLVGQLRGRVRPELALDDVQAEVELIQIDRDASAYSDIPPDTWTLAFGWYMHGIFDMAYGFPFHPNLSPVFVSFHCSKRAMLTDEAVDYLRRYAPIGCRDWTTVDILLSLDVPAFFSGCLTTTVNTVFPDGERAAADAPAGYVDVPSAGVPAGGKTYAHQYDSVRFTSFVGNVYDGIELLQTYRRTHRELVTSRLHCYLPSRSIGVPVDFQPKNRSDPRFAGLIDITDAEFDRMRSTINAKLAEVMRLILSGAETRAVYARWRELNADDVAVAQARRAEVHPPREARSNLVADVERVRGLVASAAVTDRAEASPEEADPVHVAVFAGRADHQPLARLLRSLAAHASRPVDVVVVSRDLDTLGDLAEPGGPVSVRLVRTDGLGNDLRRGDGRPATDRDVDLLALPEVLATLDRLLVLPVDSLVLGDVTEMADLDLGGQLLAAPTVVGERASSGFVLIHTASSRLKAKTQSSAELRRRAYARHRFDFDAYDVDVLVLDAAEFRRRGVLASGVPLIEEFGLTARELLHLETGPHRATVPPAWHVVPSRSEVEGACLVHWADRAKPWSEILAPAEQLWFDPLT
ncbi:hypothetical protein [uncultured Friedmanniella sp.]|uniref:hypothetical protein n=1 Tax=uncultured Friedmanniella sp. TaxID=335381 RepID=UPI0035CC6DA5